MVSVVSNTVQIGTPKHPGQFGVRHGSLPDAHSSTPTVELLKRHASMNLTGTAEKTQYPKTPFLKMLPPLSAEEIKRVVTDWITISDDSTQARSADEDAFALLKLAGYHQEAVLQAAYSQGNLPEALKPRIDAWLTSHMEALGPSGQIDTVSAEIQRIRAIEDPEERAQQAESLFQKLQRDVQPRTPATQATDWLIQQLSEKGAISDWAHAGEFDKIERIAQMVEQIIPLLTPQTMDGVKRIPKDRQLENYIQQCMPEEPLDSISDAKLWKLWKLWETLGTSLVSEEASYNDRLNALFNNDVLQSLTTQATCDDFVNHLKAANQQANIVQPYETLTVKECGLLAVMKQDLTTLWVKLRTLFKSPAQIFYQASTKSDKEPSIKSNEKTSTEGNEATPFDQFETQVRSQKAAKQIFTSAEMALEVTKYTTYLDTMETWIQQNIQVLNQLAGDKVTTLGNWMQQIAAFHKLDLATCNTLLQHVQNGAIAPILSKQLDDLDTWHTVANASEFYFSKEKTVSLVLSEPLLRSLSQLKDQKATEQLKVLEQLQSALQNNDIENSQVLPALINDATLVWLRDNVEQASTQLATLAQSIPDSEMLRAIVSRADLVDRLKQSDSKLIDALKEMPEDANKQKVIWQWLDENPAATLEQIHAVIAFSQQANEMLLTHCLADKTLRQRVQEGKTQAIVELARKADEQYGLSVYLTPTLLSAVEVRSDDQRALACNAVQALIEAGAIDVLNTPHAPSIIETLINNPNQSDVMTHYIAQQIRNNVDTEKYRMALPWIAKAKSETLVSPTKEQAKHWVTVYQNLQTLGQATINEKSTALADKLGKLSAQQRSQWVTALATLANRFTTIALQKRDLLVLGLEVDPARLDRKLTWLEKCMPEGRQSYDLSAFIEADAQTPPTPERAAVIKTLLAASDMQITSDQLHTAQQALAAHMPQLSDDKEAWEVFKDNMISLANPLKNLSQENIEKLFSQTLQINGATTFPWFQQAGFGEVMRQLVDRVGVAKAVTALQNITDAQKDQLKHMSATRQACIILGGPSLHQTEANAQQFSRPGNAVPQAKKKLTHLTSTLVNNLCAMVGTNQHYKPADTDNTQRIDGTTPGVRTKGNVVTFSDDEDSNFGGAPKDESVVDYSMPSRVERQSSQSSLGSEDSQDSGVGSMTSHETTSDETTSDDDSSVEEPTRDSGPLHSKLKDVGAQAKQKALQAVGNLFEKIFRS